MFRNCEALELPMLRLLLPVVLLAAAAFALTLSPLAAVAGDVNIYSYRQEFLIRPFLDRFTAASGIRVNVVFAKKGMLERLKAEGRNSPAG